MEAIKKLHAHLIVTGLYRCSSAMPKVLTSYALSSTNLTHARLVFEQIEDPNIYTWNTMIRGLAQSDTPKDAIFFYNRMRERGQAQDNLTFPFVLKACARVLATREGKRIHSNGLKLGLVSDVFISNALIHLYASCGDLSCARLLFDEMPVRDLVSWNSLICGYSQNNQLREVLRLFEAMQKEGVTGDKVTMVKVVSACTHMGEWELAESMVKYIEENCVEVDIYLGNTLIDYYGRRGLVESARRVFSEMKERNIVTLNTMITTYAKSGDLVSARRIFDSMPGRDLISWSSMITGYSQANHFSEALVLFRQMQKAKVKPDEIVVVSVLSACAHLGALGLGKWIHNYIRRNNIKADIYVGNSLIDMYSKCGCVMEAFKVFGGMNEKDTLSWNSIILGLANNGYVESALEVFSDMLKEGFQPNDVTFLGVLIACAHSGLVDKGLEYFESMKEIHGVVPQMKHYGCVVDLLSRSGELEKAHRFITYMPMRPDPIIWRTLLGACKVYGDVTLAEIATKKLLESDPSNSGNYVLLSNAYASANRWYDAMKVREMMADTDVEKIPGCSSIQVSNLEGEYKTAKVPILTKNQVAVA
ncbi:pentatricopeptide repeat-containing protein At2g22410, mitochondrial-like [Phoenix dactylifera]|uniref:Pentatricopeptide repeat-containing protein At2g22410, mitochondrial-like n=1 Tax=Phoenix dactylifera TaxID=42345 RepID=A0A8B7MTL6_PHODC|nr:pentatricopeptide repeat-containing protein At2g22410, mitochondrial-like [Phoenix dactylifera]XP_026659987.2 pentatricopeptide repeat-containing protein At2g22410, mitochondrial-like [Phoenix dactylifera]XP_026659988.2 pentatricopeptide repeat-containing protein At2g22410, mitochondrial-like [Phoenix dactylifera]